MERTVILGGSGFVGRELADFFGCPSASLSGRGNSTALDATRTDDLRSKLADLRPEILINCVGLADVDRAEREPGLANSLNREVVDNLVRIQPELNFRLIHISTDYVFDGDLGNYSERDPVHPINEYGRSKRRGEVAALLHSGNLVLRISSPYGRGFGARKPQFFRYVTESLRSGRPVKAITDQRVTATYLPDLARAIETLVRGRASGVVHVGSEEPLSRFEFAKAVALVVKAEVGLVTAAVRSEMTQWSAPRPRDTTLNVGLSRQLGIKYTPVDSALRTLLRS
jgi:dTDP-4-dehydrorhamnose reductase